MNVPKLTREQLLEKIAAAERCFGTLNFERIKPEGGQEKAYLQVCRAAKELLEENETLLSQKGPEAGFWGRACARLVDRKNTALADVAALLAIAQELLQYAEYGDFRNGVTDPHNTSIDEGAVRANEFYTAKGKLLGALMEKYK